LDKEKRIVFCWQWHKSLYGDWLHASQKETLVQLAFTFLYGWKHGRIQNIFIGRTWGQRRAVIRQGEGLGRKSPSGAGSRGRSPGGVWGKAPRSWRI